VPCSVSSSSALCCRWIRAQKFLGRVGGDPKQLIALRCLSCCDGRHNGVGSRNPRRRNGDTGPDECVPC
jgi:hypothetical protein